VALAADRGTQRRPPRGSHRRRHPDDGLPYLPVPPDDQEKVSYADRNIALIIRASLASFGALLISQFKFIRVERPLLFLAPLLVFTVLYYLISLCVNINTRAFDIEAHRRPAEKYPATDTGRAATRRRVCGGPRYRRRGC
jgi:cellulose synthase (UDP-forming)